MRTVRSRTSTPSPDYFFLGRKRTYTQDGGLDNACSDAGNNRVAAISLEAALCGSWRGSIIPAEQREVQAGLYAAPLSEWKLSSTQRQHTQSSALQPLEGKWRETCLAS